MATITPYSEVHHRLKRLMDRSSIRDNADDRFAYDLAKMNNRSDRRNYFQTYRQQKLTQLADRSGLTETVFKVDANYKEVEIITRITPLGMSALMALNEGYVWDGKNKQKSFKLTSEWYDRELSGDVIGDWTMQAAMRLPERYKDVHKQVLLCQLFYTKEGSRWSRVL